MRSILLLTLALALPGVSLPAQEMESQSPIRARSLAMLREALSSQRAFATLKSLVSEAPHRLSGSEGAAKAVAWATAEMERIGLKNVRQEAVLVPRWTRGRTCQVSMLLRGTVEKPLRALALGGSIGTEDSGLVAEVLAVTTFSELKHLGEKAKGKIILFNRPFDPTLVSTGTAYGRAVDQRARGAIEAAKAGAVGALVRSVTGCPDDFPHTGSLSYEDGVPKIPAAAVSVVAADELSEALRRGPVTIRFHQDCSNEEPVPSANVIGEIVGSEKADEIVLLGAHLDAWDVGQGAHDDGAGCAHVLEAARLLLASGKPPRRTIRFILFMNEENGLFGAKAYANQHRDAMANHVLAIETDSGGFAPVGMTVDGSNAVLVAFSSVALELRALGLGDLRPGAGGADISVLAPFGVPLMGLKTAPDRYFDYHHTEKDTLEAVHPRELSLGAAVVAIVSLAAAEMEEALPRTSTQVSK